MVKQSLVFACAAFIVIPSSSPAGLVGLYEYSFNIDGIVSTGPTPGVNLSGFDTITGLGSIFMSFSTPGNHLAGLFVDHEIDETLNTFFNEFGATGGVAPTNFSWEIDEPGFVSGNIYTHFTNSSPLASALDNTNGVPSSAPNDVSLAGAFRFTLAPQETAVVRFDLGTTTPPVGTFFLQHTDPASNTSVYLTASLARTSDVIPEPATALWGLGCWLAVGLARRRAR